jgi:hypothetical protein
MKRNLLLVAVVAGTSALGCACRQPTPGPAVAAAAPSATPAAAPGGMSGLGGGSGGQAQVARQYLITVAAGAGEGAVREAFGRLGITALTPLGNDTFLVTLGEDPGLARVEELGRQDPRIRAVQPNFVSRAN